MRTHVTLADTYMLDSGRRGSPPGACDRCDPGMEQTGKHAFRRTSTLGGVLAHGALNLPDNATRPIPVFKETVDV